MNETRWVQHISGQGEKWKVAPYGGAIDYRVHDGAAIDYRVHAKTPGNIHYLPKSEYVPCSPPEVWVDVTGECEVIKAAPGIPANFIGGIESNNASVLYEPTFHATRYRLRKIAIAGGLGHAFIVERKQS